MVCEKKVEIIFHRPEATGQRRDYRVYILPVSTTSSEDDGVAVGTIGYIARQKTVCVVREFRNGQELLVSCVKIPV